METADRIKTAWWISPLWSRKKIASFDIATISRGKRYFPFATAFLKKELSFLWKKTKSPAPELKSFVHLFTPAVGASCPGLSLKTT